MFFVSCRHFPIKAGSDTVVPSAHGGTIEKTHTGAEGTQACKKKKKKGQSSSVVSFSLLVYSRTDNLGLSLGTVECSKVDL